MVKSIFTNLSKGLFFTLGKLIAWFVIGFLIYYLFNNTDSINILPIVRGVY